MLYCLVVHAMLRTGSPQSCETLDWAWNLKDNTPLVCAAGIFSGVCAPKMNYTSAAGYCQSRGARLCTSLELASGKFGQCLFCCRHCNLTFPRIDVASGSGCDKLDLEEVWSFTKCTGLFAVSQSGAAVGLALLPAQCKTTSSILSVRCCADSGLCAPPLDDMYSCAHLDSAIAVSPPQARLPGLYHCKHLDAWLVFHTSLSRITTISTACTASSTANTATKYYYNHYTMLSE